ncbi:unnamed protein product [Heligmosomoides polygyrus]|uniref:DUF5641 domain-containing protein n=1 Tax=Heligmosomoides polygyrus TaxID=6339 RepID=A0A183GBA3_HELPZ|nr:unnamed protein product [Heligmosomoides polygyrus]
MERLYNRKHGARSKSFKQGDPVFVSNHNEQRLKWSSGVVQERMGRVLYKVRIGHQIWMDTPCKPNAKLLHRRQQRHGYRHTIRDLRFGASPSSNFTAYFDTALH